MRAQHLRQVLLVVIAALVGLGLVAVYSASAMAGRQTYGQDFYFLTRHVVATLLGLGLGMGCLLVPYPTVRAWAKWIVFGSLCLLVIVFLLGHEAGGARRWFRLGRWSFQPSEIAQLALVLYLADVMARKRAWIRDFWQGVLPPLLVTGVGAGLVLLQPDLGTAVVMGGTVLVMLLVARARWQHVALVAAVAAAVFVLLVAGAEYRRQRLLVFLNPWQDPGGAGYQILQSYFALARGGLIGHGLGGSLQKLFYLPGVHTDFIFAIIGEELGLLGTTAIMALFALLVLCGFRLAMLAEDAFSKYLICGLVALIGMEALVNMAVVTGLLPTKGLPLPFISYGGTATVMNLVACALILKASRSSDLRMALAQADRKRLLEIRSARSLGRR